MLASLLIIGVSTALFLYWFRYTCELILSTRTSASYAIRVSEAYGLNWSRVAASLEVAPSAALNQMQQGLSHDFNRLNLILDRSAAIEADEVSFERGMLRGYFCCCGAAFSVMQRCSENSARLVLSSMAQVVEHYANLIGERSGSAEASLG